MRTVARALLDIGAVIFAPDAPVTFKSGIVSPFYVDNRRVPFHPAAWHQVIDGFQALIDEHQVDFDVIAGIETAGIPHSAALAYALHRPSVFVRKQPKEHGMKRRVEGGDVAGQRVLLVEDVITTGGSSLSGAEALRDESAAAVTCFAIFSYEFPQAARAFESAGVRLFTLTSFEELLAEARFTNDLTIEAVAAINAWRQSITE